MDYLFYFAIVVLGLIIWSFINDKKYQKNLKKHLEREWASYPEEDYNADKMKSIKSFYLTEKDQYLDVDDITWNDLDMDEIYKLMNNTQSSLGEEYLYALLRKPCFSSEELEERNRLIEFFQSNKEERLQVQIKLNKVGKLRKISVFDYINKLGEQKPESNIPHYLMALGLLLSLGYVL